MTASVTTLESAPAAPKARPKSEPQAEILKPVNGSADFSGQYARLRIAVDPNAPGGKEAVFLGVAGTGFQVPRGKDWIVPVELANVLRDANTTSYERDAADKGWDRVESPRFSYVATNLSDDEAAELLGKQREQIAAA